MSNSGRTVEWRDGFPFPVYIEPYSKDSYQNLFAAAAATRYLPRRRRDYDEEPRCGKENCQGCPQEAGDILPAEQEFVSMTCAEVAAIRAARRASDGDLEAFEKMSDRIIGKPKQEQTNTNINVDIHAVLGGLLAKEKEATQPQLGYTVDVEEVKEIDYLEGL